MGVFNYLKSTILSKIVIAVTGVILLLFLIGHSIGNLQVYLGRDVYNSYAHFLQSATEVLWIVRIVLIISLILHIITSVRLKLYNLQSKPQKYAVKNFVRATLTSRTMIWTGIAIFLFVLYHLLHLTFDVIKPVESESPEYYQKDASLYIKVDEKMMLSPEVKQIEFNGKKYALIEDGKILFQRNDVFTTMIRGFKVYYVSIIYIIGVIILGFHLNHAIQSSFQTLGWNHPRYFSKIVSTL